MDIKRFAQQLDDEAAYYMSDNDNSRPRAFAHSLVERVKDQLGIDNYQMAYGVQKNSVGNVLGEIYGYSISLNKEVLTLIYSLYNDDLSEGIKTVSNTEFQTAVNKLQGFYKQCFNGSIYNGIAQDDPVFELADFLYQRTEKKKQGRPSTHQENGLVTVRLLVFSNSFIPNAEIKNYRIPGRNTRLEVYDISKLYQLFNTNSDHQEINIEFGDEYKYKLPFIGMEAQAVGYKCFMTMFPGKLLYRLYEQYNTGLLLNNVRYFLGFKGSEKNNANIGIQKTLREQKHMFLAYNNGIVALAKEINFESSTDGTSVDQEDNSRIDNVKTGIISEIKDFQIVNGGQTTAALFSAKKLNSGEPISLTGVYVPVKIIVINNEDNKKVAEDITKFSNSQSKVKYADFSVSNPYNMSMQNLSRTTKTPDGKYWYYERLRGQYDQDLSSINSKDGQTLFRNMYDKKNRLFKKELLAKVWKCWQNAPFDVVKGEATNYDLFLRYVIKNDITPDEEYFKQSVALVILWNFIYNLPEVKATSNCRAPLTAYTMAYMLNSNMKKFNLLKVWEEQKVNNNLTEYILRLSKAMLSTLEEIAHDSQKSVLSCSKSEGTYSEIKRRGVFSAYDLIRDYYE